MLIRGGENIYPSLYEPALATAARLEAAVMVAVGPLDADYDGGVEPGRRRQRGLVQRRVDVLAAADEHLLPPAAKDEPATGVESAEVAGRQLRDGLRLAEIAAGERRAGDVELAALVGPQPHAGERRPDEITVTLVERQSLPRVHERHQQVLRHPVDRGDPDAGQRRRKRPQGGVADRRAAGRPGSGRS